MSRGRHARDGQRRDALRAWLTRHIPAIPISRRVPRAAGGAAGPTPTAVAPEAPAPSGAPVRQQRAGASPQLRVEAEEEAGRPPWVTWHGPPGTPPPPPRLAPRRDTIAMPAVNAALSARYLAAHEAWRDAPAVTS
jgi:hypothetical protein